MSLAHTFARTKQILEQEGNLPAMDADDRLDGTTVYHQVTGLCVSTAAFIGALGMLKPLSERLETYSYIAVPGTWIAALDGRPRARLALDFIAQFPPSVLIFLSLLTLAVCFFWNQVPEAEGAVEPASSMEPDPSLEGPNTGANGIAKAEDIDDSIFDSPGMRIARRARPLVRSKFAYSVTLVMKSCTGLVGYFSPAYIVLCFGFSNFLPYVDNAGVRVGAVAFGAQLACVWRWRSFGSNVLPIFRAGT